MVGGEECTHVVLAEIVGLVTTHPREHRADGGTN